MSNVLLMTKNVLKFLKFGTFYEGGLRLMREDYVRQGTTHEVFALWGSSNVKNPGILSKWGKIVGGQNSYEGGLR